MHEPPGADGHVVTLDIELPTNTLVQTALTQLKATTQ